MITVTLDGRRIAPEQLPDSFYLYRHPKQLGDATPRRTRDEILRIIETSKEDIELSHADMPFAKIYKTGGDS